MLSYALIGCGRISANHINAAQKNGLEIVGVCDLISEKTDTVCREYGLDKTGRFTDYRDMLASVKPDIVAIATDSGRHAAIALDCLDYNCNLIIEKPIAMSIKDADAVIAKAALKGVKASACHQNRFNIAVQATRKAIERGRFGKLSNGAVCVRWNRDSGYYKQAAWRGTRAMDGGALMNQSIHGIDIFRWMMGDEIEEVSAYKANRFHGYIECEDIGAAVVKFKNGAIGTIEGTTNTFPRDIEETLYLFGSDGSVKLGGKSMNSIELWEFRDAEESDGSLKRGMTEETRNVYGNGHVSVYGDMVLSIAENREPYVGLDAGKRALETVLAIYASAEEGRPVKLPLGC